MFTVEVLKNKNVSILKDLIKEKKAPHLNHVAASDLELWMVNIHLDGLGAKPVNVDLDIQSKLSPPGKKLSSFFYGALNDESLHIIAKAPGISHQSFSWKHI